MTEAAADRRLALITGAGSGIGRCFAEVLAGAASDLLLLDVDQRGLEQTAASLGGRGVRIATAVADVAERVALERAVAEHVAPRGRLDLLINCAAILGPGTWAAQSPEDFERVLRVDLVGTANTIRATLPWLGAAGGQVVNLASTAA